MFRDLTRRRRDSASMRRRRNAWRLEVELPAAPLFVHPGRPVDRFQVCHGTDEDPLAATSSRLLQVRVVVVVAGADSEGSAHVALPGQEELSLHVQATRDEGVSDKPMRRRRNSTRPATREAVDFVTDGEEPASCRCPRSGACARRAARAGAARPHASLPPTTRGRLRFHDGALLRRDERLLAPHGRAARALPPAPGTR